MENNLFFEKYNKRTHLIGKISTLIIFAMLLGSPFLIGAIFGALPNMKAILRGYLSVGIVWMITSIAEFVLYTPMLGAGGSYLAYITGNLINMKIPCAINAKDIAQVKTGTPENEIISTLSIAVSSLVTILVLTIGVLLLQPLQPFLQNPALQPAFSNVVAALFGSMAYKYFRKDIVTSVFPFTIMAILFLLVPSLTSSTSIMIVPSGGIAILVAWIRHKKSLNR